MFALAPDLLIAAQTLNTYYNTRLGWPDCLTPWQISNAAPLAQIAGIQQQSGVLLVDGVLGPKTRAHLQGKTWRPPQAGYLIVAGEKIVTPFPTVTFDQEAGFSFYAQGGWQPREKVDGSDIDLLVLHWDACISSAHCFAVLLQRGLAVHLMLDADGTVYQALDLAVAQAWHARQQNERSIGIEIQNAVLPRPELAADARRGWIIETLPHTDTPWGHLDFTPEQKACTQVLVPWLCKTMGIPAILPRTAKGQVPTSLCALPFTGVCGHYHLQTDKVDPGLTLWPLLTSFAQRGASS